MDAQIMPQARRAAGRLLRQRGYDREAAIILAGEGDDFAEVRIALELLNSQRRIVEALATYADEAFWDEAGASISPACADRGELARSALGH